MLFLIQFDEFKFRYYKDWILGFHRNNDGWKYGLVIKEPTNAEYKIGTYYLFTDDNEAYELT